MRLAYDADCGFCSAAVEWLRRQRFRDGSCLEVVPYGDPDISRKMPGIDMAHADGGVQLVLADGSIARDAAAVAAILRATVDWKFVGELMDVRGIRQIVQMGYRLVATNRRRISRWMGLTACRLPTRP